MPKQAGKTFFKSTFGNENLHEINNDNDARVANFAHPKF
jgi:hypothetical protein